MDFLTQNRGLHTPPPLPSHMRDTLMMTEPDVPDKWLRTLLRHWTYIHAVVARINRRW
jgi:hypothetical protein